MCGIAGVGGYRTPIDARWILNMTRALRHRGPDDEGYLAIDNPGNKAYHLTGGDSQVKGAPVQSFSKEAGFYLGHRRLSILDPTPSGHQPMQEPGGGSWVVFNGEIYNYVELREELKQAGFHFHTGSDTEVLLAAYKHWGEGCLDKFDGMWAFVIYDPHRKLLFGARDRFGVKPLYYFHHKNHFAFASEIKALVTLPFITPRLNREALFDFLAFSGLHFIPDTFFKDIFELLPAHAFRYRLPDHHLETWQYYKLSYEERWRSFDSRQAGEYISGVRERVVQSVQWRLRSDVPVGSALSGGLDSSAVVCVIRELMKRQPLPADVMGERQPVFTASFPGSAIDETRWAHIAARHADARIHLVQPTAEEFREDFEDIVYSQDTPFGTPSVYAQYRVMKLARESGVKVLLDGQGADELFTGYTIYYPVFLYRLLSRFNMKTLLNEWRHLENAPIPARSLLSQVMRRALRGFIPFSLVEKRRQTRREHHNLINPQFWDRHKERFQLIRARDFSSLNQMLFEFFTRQKLVNLLKFEDRNSMRFSIESRTPFADSLPLVEYVFRIPEAYKIHNGWSKYLLREAMKGILPDDIRLRTDKKGFFVPDRLWLEQLKNTFSQYIDKDMAEFVDINAVTRDLRNGMPGAGEEALRMMWNIVGVAAWRKKFNI